MPTKKFISLKCDFIHIILSHSFKGGLENRKGSNDLKSEINYIFELVYD